MSTAHRLSSRIAQLVAERRRFVQATVVRAQCPTSARPGDAAIVLPDGAIEGFVGGQCAENSVRTAALDVLASGESTLLRILPEGSDEFPDAPGSITTVNPCLSGGAIEVFLEPKLPATKVTIVGGTPIADALAEFGASLGFAMSPAAPGEGLDGASALLIASHGRGEEEAIRAGLDADVGFIGLVASRTRGAAVVDSLDLDPAEASRVHSPVGIEIGARTAEEIALSILAQVVRAIRVDGLLPPDEAVDAPATATDPICGMTVTIGPDSPHHRHAGTDFWYCNPGCRTRHLDELAAAG